MRNNRTPSRIAAQVAVEAIVNEYGHGYDAETMIAVLAHAENENVSDFFLEPLRSIIDNAA